MSLQKELYERLNILEKGGLIAKNVKLHCKQVVEILLEEKPDIDDEKAAIFITHLAMASQRMKDGKEENPMDPAIVEQVKLEESYLQATGMAEKMFALEGVSYSQVEADYLMIHLCNLFS